jgi:hypothetical protein
MHAARQAFIGWRAAGARACACTRCVRAGGRAGVTGRDDRRQRGLQMHVGCGCGLAGCAAQCAAREEIGPLLCLFPRILALAVAHGPARPTELSEPGTCAHRAATRWYYAAKTPLPQNPSLASTSPPSPTPLTAGPTPQSLQYIAWPILPRHHDNSQCPFKLDRLLGGAPHQTIWVRSKWTPTHPTCSAQPRSLLYCIEQQ